MTERTILKLHANGDFEVVDTLFVEGDGYSFGPDAIKVPSIISLKNIPQEDSYWVVDTGNPISFFPQGVVIKGELIQTIIEPPLENVVIFEDNFERPNSNNLGANWQNLSGGFSISNGLARNHIVTLPESISVTNVGTQNNIGIELGVLIPNIREGIVFRVVDVSNHIKVQYNTNRNLLSVVIKVNGAETVLAETTLNLTKGEPYSFRVELRGEEIKVFVDNELKITTRESRFIETERCGMLGYSMDYTNGGYDSFEVRRLGN